MARILSASRLALSAASIHIWSGRNTETFPIGGGSSPASKVGEGADAKLSQWPTGRLLTTFKVKMKTRRPSLMGSNSSLTASG